MAILPILGKIIAAPFASTPPLPIERDRRLPQDENCTLSILLDSLWWLWLDTFLGVVLLGQRFSSIRHKFLLPGPRCDGYGAECVP